MTNSPKKIFVLLGLLAGSILLLVLMAIFDNSRSITNKAYVTDGFVGIRYETTPIQVALGSTFTNNIQAYAKSGTYGVTGLQVYITDDPRLEIKAASCLAPFTGMVYEAIDPSSVTGRTIARLFCISKTPQNIGVAGVNFAQVTYKVRTDATNGRATLAFNNNYAVGAINGDTEPKDVAVVGEQKIIDVGTGIEPTVPPEDTTKGDLKPAQIAHLNSGGDNCITFTFPIMNVGKAAVSSYKVRLYVDPTNRPPLSTTTGYTELSSTGPIAVGAEQSFQKQVCGLLPAVDHVAYVWVDPANLVVEADETNNVEFAIVNYVRPTNTPAPTSTPGEGTTATIQGYLYIDQNNFGTREIDEVGLLGVKVTAVKGTTALETTTYSEGGYEFANLVPGTYTVNVPQNVQGYTVSTTVPQSISVVAGQIRYGVNFGYTSGTVPTFTPTPTPTRPVATQTPRPTATGTSVPASCPNGDKGNLNCGADGKIDIYDLVLMTSEFVWQKPAPTLPFAQVLALKYTPDISGNDGVVNALDLARLLMYWTRN